MTTDNALMNRKTRVRSSITSADTSEPAMISNFTQTKGCSYVELSLNGLTGAQISKIRPLFYEIVNNAGTMINYVSHGAEIQLSLTDGDTCNIPGVNGRPIYIKVTEITAGATINIDLAPGRVPPGINT
jgi:cell wall assembly regulator SMI1